METRVTHNPPSVLVIRTRGSSVGSITPPGSAPLRRFRLRPGRKRPVIMAVLVLAFLATFLIDWAVTLPGDRRHPGPERVGVREHRTSQHPAVHGQPDERLHPGHDHRLGPRTGRGRRRRRRRSGGFAQTATTSDTGRWSVSVTAAGSYTVSVDQDTLPKGQYLTNAADAKRTVSASLNANVGQIFQLSDQQGSSRTTTRRASRPSGPGSSSRPASDSGSSSRWRPWACRSSTARRAVELLAR